MLLWVLLGAFALLALLSVALQLLLPGRQWGYRLFVSVLVLVTAYLLFEFVRFMLHSLIG